MRPETLDEPEEALHELLQTENGRICEMKNLKMGKEFSFVFWFSTRAFRASDYIELMFAYESYIQV